MIATLTFRPVVEADRLIEIDLGQDIGIAFVKNRAIANGGKGGTLVRASLQTLIFGRGVIVVFFHPYDSRIARHFELELVGVRLISCTVEREWRTRKPID